MSELNMQLIFSFSKGCTILCERMSADYLLDTVRTNEYLACARGSRIYNGSAVTSYLQTVASPSPQKYSSVNYVDMFQLSEAVA